MRMSSKQALNLSGPGNTMRRRRKEEWARSYTFEAAGRSIEDHGRGYGAKLNDFGLAVTRMFDVHVNRQEGEGGGEGDGEEKEEGFILTINRRESV